MDLINLWIMLSNLINYGWHKRVTQLISKKYACRNAYELRTLSEMFSTGMECEKIVADGGKSISKKRYISFVS